MGVSNSMLLPWLKGRPLHTLFYAAGVYVIAFTWVVIIGAVVLDMTTHVKLNAMGATEHTTLPKTGT